MQDFIFHIPTRIYFGKDQISQLGQAIHNYGGSKVLLTYGGGSIKRNGIYEKVTQALQQAEVDYVEFGGIEPNPRLSSAIRGVEVVKKEGIDFILSVGGGSTIDCSKLIAAAACTQADPWDIVLGKQKAREALPLGVVLTLSATGSEMDNSSVITNEKTKEKLGWASDAVLPRFAFMDPSFTYSVNAWHTAAGTADIMSHTMENYFSTYEDCFLQDTQAEGILRTCLRYGKLAYQEPENYEARANLMWAGTWAINGYIDRGKHHRWSVHAMEHEISAQYDITHGVGLAILTPRWLKHFLNQETEEKIVRFGKWVFDLDGSGEEGARTAIQALYDYFKDDLHIPMSLEELDIDDSLFHKMAVDTIQHAGGPIQGFQLLDGDDVEAIYQDCLGKGWEA